MAISPAAVRDIIREEMRDALRRALEVAMDTGTATGGTASTLEDTSKGWGADVWKEGIVEIVAGRGEGQIRRISSNTGTALNITPNWVTAPDTTSVYAIRLPGIRATDITDKADRVVGQITDGTGSISPSEFGSSTHPRNAFQWGGTALTGRDISADLADLPSILAKLDITVSDLRDALRGVDARTLTNLHNLLTSIGGKVATEDTLGTLGTETTLTDARDRLTELKGKTPAATSYTATAAATEYSFDLPAGTRRFTLKARGGRIDIGFVTAERPIQIAEGGSYWEDMLDLPSARTVYYSSPTAGAVAEVLYWT